MERYKRILVPIDGSELSKLAFEQALSLAKMVNGDVTVIHIIEPYTPGTFDFDVYEIMNSIEIIEEKTKNAMESQLNELVELGKERNVTVNSIIKKGNVSDELIKESSNYDLIIMGILGQSALTKLFLGSVAEKVSRHACCPVMLVREIGKVCKSKN